LPPGGKADVSQVHPTGRARADLSRIWVDIALDNQTAADRVDERLEARVRRLEQFPEAGLARPDIANDARVLVASPDPLPVVFFPAGYGSSMCCTARGKSTKACLTRASNEPDQWRATQPEAHVGGLAGPRMQQILRLV
jgi:plasmid stabilization system protein ParE